MKLRYKALIGLFVVSLAGGLVWSANHYRDKYQAEKARADTAESLAHQRQDTITDMQKRQRENSALDEKYTGELADAKETIEKLRDDVAAGTRRVYIKSSCPTSASGETKPGGVGHAPSARLDDSAIRNYFTLRERIGTITKQVDYLQDYIRQQCLQ